MMPSRTPAFTLRGERLSADSLTAMLRDKRNCYRANDTGIMYDVDYAKQLVELRPRDFVYVPVFMHPPDPALDRSHVMSRDHKEPGIVLFYVHPADGPQYQLIDGNHRMEKCRALGVPYFAAYPLTPDEARECAWFVAAETPAPDIAYRHYYEEGKVTYHDEREIDNLAHGRNPSGPFTTDYRGKGE